MTRGRLAAARLIILAAAIGGWRWLSHEDERLSILLVTIDTLRGGAGASRPAMSSPIRALNRFTSTNIVTAG
jgi:hypothetical protein